MMRIIEPPTLTRKLFLSAVLELWRRGFDTQQIATTLRDEQANVERALHEAMSIERKENLDAR